MSNQISRRNDLIAYILNNASNKLPMKLSDIIVGKKDLEEALTALKEDFGIIFEELPDKKAGKKYICYAENTTQFIEELNMYQKRETALLFIILSYIFMVDGQVYEEKLQHFLEGLGIYYNEDHYYFGPNLKKLITETFVKQLYLKKKKSEAELDTEVKYIFEWGFRAEREFQKMKVLEAAAKLMGKNPQAFSLQFEQAEKNLTGADSDVEML